eukprot:5581139-Amphidinium_carterae.1
MLMTILLCIHYSYFGSTSEVRQSLASMAGLPLINGHSRVPAPGDPQFADFVHRILTTGYAPDLTMETAEEQPGQPTGNVERDAAAQSIANSSSMGSTVDGQTTVAMESMMWDSIVSRQCSPLVRQQLQEAE